MKYLGMDSDAYLPVISCMEGNFLTIYFLLIRVGNSIFRSFALRSKSFILKSDRERFAYVALYVT